MNCEFEYSSGIKYLIINRNSNSSTYSFTEKMVINAKISGLIDMDIRIFNEESKYYYNINSKKSINSFFREKELSLKNILSLLNSISKIKTTLAEFLIDDSSLCLNPEFIFYDVFSDQFYFCVIPDNVSNIIDDYLLLSEFLIDNVSADDEKATSIAYEFFENINKEVFDISGFLNSSAIIDDYETKEAENAKDASIEEIEESFYFTEPVILENAKDSKSLIHPLIICASIILIAGFSYALIFLNPALLKHLGIAQENYIIIGAALACFLSIIIYFIVRLYLAKEEKREVLEKELEEEKLQKGMNPGKMELLEYEMKQSLNNFDNNF